MLDNRLGGLGVLVALLWAAFAATAPADATPALSWLGPVPVDPQAAPSAISCASTALCVAVDDRGHALVATNPGAGPGATWTRVEIDGTRVLTGVSCPSTALCVAVDDEGRALIATNPGAGLGATWRQVDIDEKHALAGVSCPSTALCVAVDGEGRALVATNPGLGASWSATGIDEAADGLRAVSCPTTALCVAVDAAGRALVSGDPGAAAPSWRSRPIDPSLGLVSISCTAAALCAAVDAAGDALASANAAAPAPTWSSTEIDPLGTLTGVSCTAAGLCVAVDGTGRALASDNPTAAAPAWQQSGPASAFGYAGVACVPEGLCAAVDAGGRAFVARVPAPAVATGPPSEVTQGSATVTGAVNPNDAALTECRFEYGLSVVYGQSVPCTSQPAPGGAAGAASAQLTGLVANTSYHYRVAATSAIGTTYGLDETFKTQAPSLVQPHPSISGTPAPGQRLSCHSGISSAATGVTLQYAWLRDLGAIRGAGGSTYVVGGADVSRHLQCQVTAINSGGSATATSSFVTVPAGGLGSISETTVGPARAAGTAVGVTLTCSRQAAGSCTITLRLTAVETLRGNSVIAIAARSAARTRRRTVTLGATTVRLSPGQRRTVTVSLNATGRRLLARRHRLTARLSVTGTVVGAIKAALASATVTFGSGRTAAVVRRTGIGRASGASRADRARQAGGATPVDVLAPTPYMGWDSYFAFGVHFDEATVLEQASQLVTRGLEREGYRYVWLDVGWWQGGRDASGQIVVNPAQWPHGMAWLASTLHGAGFRVGLYTDAGSEGCGGQRQGSYGHYQQDVDTFAAWGFDAVKVDFCGGVRMGLDPAGAYAAFHEAIVHNASRRPLLLSICNFLQPGQFAAEVPTLAGSGFASYTFGPSVGNSWRTDTDVGVPGSVQFTQVLRNLDADAAQPEAAGPGHWNDPDYLGPDQGMSSAQFRTQFSMWAMLAAPLMISDDLVSISGNSQTTVSNREVVAIDQDPAGVQGRMLAANGSGQVWVKPLHDGSRAVALLNRGSSTLSIATSAAAVGMGRRASAYTLRNVWTGAIGTTGSQIATSVPGGSTVLYRVSARP